MNDHIEKSCPNTKVDCTFAQIGCKVKVSNLKGLESQYKSITCGDFAQLFLLGTFVTHYTCTTLFSTSL